jgi:hypothetical protein
VLLPQVRESVALVGIAIALIRDLRRPKRLLDT